MKIRIAVIAALATVAGCSKAPDSTDAAASERAAATLSAPPAEIVIPGERIIPESLTSTSDGTVIIGGVGTRTIYRAAPGSATADAWIEPANDIQSVFGVLADEASGTLYACSGALGPPAEGQTPVTSALYTFDLQSGSYRAHYPLPTAAAACNDIAVDAAGNAYVTDTTNMLVGRLAKGADRIEVWAGAGGEFGPPGGVLDGIAVVGDRLLVNALITSKLFAVPIGSDGKPGAVSEVVLDTPLDRPDGMRTFGANGLLVAEGGGEGRLSQVVIDGNAGTRTTLREGFPDGAVAVTVVGNTAYVLEAQFAAMRAEPGTPAKPFKATAVVVGAP